MSFVKSDLYSLDEALNIIKSKTFKFNESIEISVNLDVLPKSKKFSVRGFSKLPYGKVSNYRIAVFSDDESIYSKLNYDGCILLKENDLSKIKKKDINFDLVITTPSSLIKFGKFSKILNSKGIMPDIKYGTISNDLNSALDLFRNNMCVKFKSDKNYVLNTVIGNVNLSNLELSKNFYILINDIKSSKPKDCKNMFFKSIFLSSTMGVGIKLDMKSLLG